MKRLLIIIIFVGASFLGRSQDAHLSMYDASPLYLNPAMTGVFEGNWRLHAQYRTQWKSVNYKPYNSALLSLDVPKGKWGFGGQISNFRAGFGNYNAAQGMASVAYTTPIDKGKGHNISFGLQAGLAQKSVEYQLLSYDNQYTTSNGGGFDQTISSGEDFQGQSIIVPVTNAGVMYFFSKQQAFLNPFVGVSAFNLIEPRETFLGNDNDLPMRFFGHIGTRINITETFYVLPKVLFMYQREFQEQTYAVDVGYFLKGAELYLIGGLIYREADAGIITVGAKMDHFVAKIGYDFNVSTLSTVSSGRGGLELSFTYIHIKNKPKTAKICPRL
ncbi:MAG: PorP/SprF family type IX secretion system membrane protein [Crocinitomicaceae bacterium]|nr:PorP/SprF family type IX secretion system membrane protein [Crocinitomicaceae bacterium]